MARSRTLIVAGAGIGGLSAAIALARAGYRVIVLERAEKLDEIGAAISPARCLAGAHSREGSARALRRARGAVVARAECTCGALPGRERRDGQPRRDLHRWKDGALRSTTIVLKPRLNPLFNVSPKNYLPV